MFCRINTFNYDISQWDTSSVTNMRHMFRDAHSYKKIDFFIIILSTNYNYLIYKNYLRKITN